MSEASEDDLIPVSVRLGQVVPPEDPEDWTRPLTWVAALGMLVGPIVALGWFLLGPPTAGGAALPATYLVAFGLVGGAAATGATQRGAAWAAAATLGSGLFGALVVTILGGVFAGERQVGAASATLAHALAAAVAGLSGAVVGALIAAVVARLRSRGVRFWAALLGGFVMAVAVMRLLI